MIIMITFFIICSIYFVRKRGTTKWSFMVFSCLFPSSIQGSGPFDSLVEVHIESGAAPSDLSARRPPKAVLERVRWHSPAFNSMASRSAATLASFSSWTKQQEYQDALRSKFFGFLQDILLYKNLSDRIT